MLAAMSSCLVLGFLLSMAEVPWVVAALLMVSLSFAVAFALHAVLGMYLHAERLLAKAGVASARRGGSPTLGAKRKGRRAAQAKRGSLGRLLARARGGAP